MARVLCCWIPNWPIQRRLVDAQSCAVNSAKTSSAKNTGIKLVLFARDSRRGQLVAACSAAAAEQGVLVGMPLAEAKALSKVSGSAGEVRPDFSVGESGISAKSEDIFQQHDPQADRVALEELALWCEQFSPLVGLEMAAEPSSLLLDVTGMESLFGDEPTLACRVVESFRHRGYFVRVGLADTIGAAWAISRSEKGTHLFSVIPSGKESILTALGPLPLTALRLPAQTIELLHSLGVLRIEQLVELPREGLISRFGDILVKRLDQALGSFNEIITAYRGTPEFQAQWSLEHPTHRREAIDPILVQLIRRVVTLLDQRNRGVIELECKLMTTTSPQGVVGWDAPISACSSPSLPQVPKTACIRVGLFQPTATVSHLLELVRLQLERLTLSGPVAKISVQAVCTAPLQLRQQELFSDDRRQTQWELALLMERLSSRLGERSVLRACLRAEAQPERAVQYVSLPGRHKNFLSSGAGASRLRAEPICKAGDNSQPLGTDTSATARPLRILSPPSKLDVIAISPDGPPLRFSHENQLHQITHHWGPERIETSWWRGRSVRRDYYRIETSQGNRFWLFQRLSDGKWFLQGMFE